MTQERLAFIRPQAVAGVLPPLAVCLKGLKAAVGPEDRTGPDRTGLWDRRTDLSTVRQEWGKLLYIQRFKENQLKFPGADPGRLGGVQVCCAISGPGCSHASSGRKYTASRAPAYSTCSHHRQRTIRKLQEAKHLPITEQDLEYLSEGLEGRSRNPVAVLFDTLLHPNADFGYEFPPVIQWRRDKKQHIPHLVLGKGTPGGAWHAMEGSMLTISLGIWMELPGVNYRDLTNGKCRDIRSDRATPEEISSYYQDYVKLNGLQKSFVDNTYVTSVQKLCRGHEVKGLENGHTEKGDKGVGNGGNERFEENEKECVMNSEGGTLWEVRGYQQVQNNTHVPFSLFAENVVLATGASDSPVRLGVEGEDLPFVFHSISNLGLAVSQRKLDVNSDPVLIVGAGLSAADAVLCACNSNIRVLHVFRKSLDNPDLIFRELPKTLYPEYHKVYNMMRSQTYTNMAPSSTPNRPQAASIASSVCAKMCPKPQIPA
ncbi:oxidative stress-induced growth inhibitor 2, partial [Austrofundulus limnaeus]|uniref:Oxidative stress-induced growth inhibitor 2 n=1 Tax=Austrofundulus limnaeus TaxID=52670 RepID=A0A2I4D2J8_AUSLI